MSKSNITAIHGGMIKPARYRKNKKEICSRLEVFLQHARAGRMKSIAIVAVTRDGYENTVHLAHATNNDLELLGAIEHLRSRIVHGW